MSDYDSKIRELPDGEDEKEALIRLIRTLSPEQVQQVIALAGKLLPPR